MRAAYIALLLFGCQGLAAVSPDAAGQAEHELFAARYDRAAELYAKLLRDDPAWAPGYYGAVRALIGANRAHEAFSLAEEGVRQAPETAEAQTAAGLAAYRGGDLTRAEACFRKALKIDAKDAAGLSGLAAIYNSVSKFKSARTLTIAAYHAAPGDPRLIVGWANTLRGDEHIAALERALAIYDPASREAQVLRARIAAARAAGKRSLRRIETPYQPYEIKLLALPPGGRQPYGVGMRVRLNQSRALLLKLDTGAPGICISQGAALKAGLEALGEEITEAHGLGDRKPAEAREYLAAEVSVGELSFADFPVRTFQSAKTDDYDGLIGTDVFERFLLTVDFKDMRLSLNPYPGEQAAAGDPRDAVDFLAPGFFRFFRIGHQIALHTSVNDGPLRLFVIDSGTSANLIDTDVAKEFSKVRRDMRTSLIGLQGRAVNVSRAGRASLVFAGLRQDNMDLLTTSLESGGDVSGVGMSGILGMPALWQMALTIDYRNGAVRFEYKK